jgi:cyanophycinase
VNRRRIFIALAACLSCVAAHAAAPYVYQRLGNAADVRTTPSEGIALMGGGADLDEAFRWLCEKGKGGDFVILRARGDDAYNPYVAGLCRVNSVATLILPDRQAALDPAVSDIIRNAEVIFIAGGDQANYIRGWQGTPVQAVIDAHVRAGKPLGGTSAGLAVFGEFAYGALGDKPDDEDLASSQVLMDPYHERVTLVRNFLRIPQLDNLITDSHFVARDRMGRTLGFLARIIENGWSAKPRAMAIDEGSAALLEASGTITVVGRGHGVYFLQATERPVSVLAGVPLGFRNVAAYRLGKGGHFDLNKWSGSGGFSYSLSVDQGRIASSAPSGSVY